MDVITLNKSRPLHKVSPNHHTFIGIEILEYEEIMIDKTYKL